MPRGVRTKCPQEIDSAEIRPVGLTEVELGVGTLPEHEPGEPLLSRGPDKEIRIGLAARVEMLCDVLHVEDLNEFLDARPGTRVLLQ